MIAAQEHKRPTLVTAATVHGMSIFEVSFLQGRRSEVGICPSVPGFNGCLYRTEKGAEGAEGAAERCTFAICFGENCPQNSLQSSPMIHRCPAERIV
jgi:hypothetical protein